MRVAKIVDNNIESINDLELMFPDTSFPVEGPNKEFLEETSTLLVEDWVPYDIDTLNYIQVPPYIQNSKVLTYTLLPKSAEELIAVENAKKQAQIAVLEDKIKLRLDNFAKSRGYTDIVSACSYINSTVETYRAEAQTCINLRDATWVAFYSYIASNPLPIVFEDLVNFLPELVWIS